MRVATTIQVSEKDLSQFESAVAVACAMKSDKPVERQRPLHFSRAARTLPSGCMAADGSLVMSFDRSWYPFLCNSEDGETVPQRWYIPKASWLVARIASALQAPVQRAISYKGGRILLDGAGVRRTPDGHAEVVVLRWNLPRESSLLCRSASSSAPTPVT